MKKQKSEDQLTDLPNIGSKVARLLQEAGLRTPHELRKAGTVTAALRILRVRPHDPPCRSMLAGLEGAIRGVRWHQIPKAERESIWKEFKAQTRAPTARATA